MCLLNTLVSLVRFRTLTAFGLSIPRIGVEVSENMENLQGQWSRAHCRVDTPPTLIQ